MEEGSPDPKPGLRAAAPAILSLGGARVVGAHLDSQALSLLPKDSVPHTFLPEAWHLPPRAVLPLAKSPGSHHGIGTGFEKQIEHLSLLANMTMGT